MITIGIHAKSLTVSQPTGVDVYCKLLIEEWLKGLPIKGVRLRAYTSTDSSAAKEQLLKTDKIDKVFIKQAGLWTQTRLPLALWGERLNRRTTEPFVLFIPAHVMPFLNVAVKTVVTIHDIAFINYPQFYSLSERMYLSVTTAYAVHAARAVIVPSHSTKKEVERFFPEARGKLVVIHHGAPIIKQSLACDGGETLKIKQAALTAKQFFLFLGELRGKKNVERVIKAFERLYQESLFKQPVYLVLAGPYGFGARRIKTMIKQSRAKNYIKQLGYVNEEEKQRLLTAARALVFPSLHEGFGLPILEAQVTGTPVITSKIASMPEVAGKHLVSSYLVNPYSTEEIAKAMAELYRQPQLCLKLAEGGRLNAERFQWSKAAKETLQLLKSVALNCNSS